MWSLQLLSFFLSFNAPDSIIIISFLYFFIICFDCIHRALDCLVYTRLHLFLNEWMEGAIRLFLTRQLRIWRDDSLVLSHGCLDASCNESVIDSFASGVLTVFGRTDFDNCWYDAIIGKINYFFCWTHVTRIEIITGRNVKPTDSSFNIWISDYWQSIFQLRFNRLLFKKKISHIHIVLWYHCFLFKFILTLFNFGNCKN